MADRNKNNPRNPESSLFKRLTRLLSGPIVNYRSQSVRNAKRRNLDKYKSRFQSASGKQFKKTAYDPFENLTANIMANQNRIERYADFEQMEYEPIIASAMDIYADEMTTSSDLKPLLLIDCPNEEIKMILDNLYQNIINIEFNLFGWCRSMCKFGDLFVYLDIDDELGVRNAIGLPSQEIERMEAQDEDNPNYVQFQWNSSGLTLENWQVAHFRILGNDKYAPYGSSVLEAARRIWRQLVLLEDAMMAYRIVRAPERRVFYVDVGSIAPEDVEQFMQKAMTQMKRNQVVDANTGRVDLRYNPLSVEEDYFIPVRGGETGTKIETVSGGSYTGDIEDVKYLKDKLFAALKIPQSYLFRGDGAEEDKTTLAQKDIRFARTIQRLQRSVVTELEKIGIVHLFTLGFRNEDLVSFKLALNNPSQIASMQELETWKTKFDAATTATEGFFSKRWIAKHLFNLSDEEFLRNQRELFYDRKFEASMEAVGEEAVGAEAGMLGTELGGEELGGEELGGEELGGEELGGPPGEEPAEEPETALLGAPGKRDVNVKIKRRKDGKTTTSKSKGKWYKDVTRDGRKDTAKLSNNRAKWGYEATKNTKRGANTGLSNLISLGRGITEEKDTTYNEEHKLFEVNHQIKSLIAELESKNNETKTQ